MLNADSEATVEIWIARKSLAILCKVGYLTPMFFQYPKMSKLLIFDWLNNTYSSKYKSNSNLTQSPEEVS